MAACDPERACGQIGHELIEMRLGRLLHRHVTVPVAKRLQRMRVGGAGRGLNVMHPSEPIPACLLDGQNRAGDERAIDDAAGDFGKRLACFVAAPGRQVCASPPDRVAEPRRLRTCGRPGSAKLRVALTWLR